MKKLVLFDIDGTLIRNINTTMTLGRFSFALKEVFGVTVRDSTVTLKFNGMLDRGILWELAKDKGVARKEFEEKFPKVIKKFKEYFDALDVNIPLYEPISEAKKLAEILAASGTYTGVLTGNLLPSAIWKLKQAGMDSHFPFGLYGHEADDRPALARLVFQKAKIHFGQTFAAKDVVVIGDTKHDVLCGKAIGAVTIAVTTGRSPNKKELLSHKPDFLVDSLMDRSIRDFFGV